MRIRTIKPEFWKSDTLADVPRGARLTFVGLWQLADSQGRLECRPRRIKAELYPYDDDVEIMAEIESLATVDAIRRYEVDGVEYLYIPAFRDHQRLSGKEAADDDGRCPPSPWEATGKQRGSNGEAVSASREAMGKQRGSGREKSGAMGKHRNREQGTGNRDQVSGDSSATDDAADDFLEDRPQDHPPIELHPRPGPGKTLNDFFLMAPRAWRGKGPDLELWEALWRRIEYELELHPDPAYVDGAYDVLMGAYDLVRQSRDGPELEKPVFINQIREKIEFHSEKGGSDDD